MFVKKYVCLSTMTVFLYTSCSQTESKTKDSVDIGEDQSSSDVQYAPVDPDSAFTHKMIKSTDENLFSSLVPVRNSY